MTRWGSPIGADTVRPRMGRRAVQRAIVVVLAIPVVGWLAISYGDADSIDSGAYLAGRAGATPGQLANAVRDLRSAGTLNPSRTDRLGVEAALEVRRGHPAAAAKLLEELVRDEPDARDAWFLLAQIYRTQDPGRAAEAIAQFKRLDPREARKLHF
jgi:tetratricopeptide (TPR) repeat protein